MGRCKYHDTHFNACARYSTFGGAYQHLVPCHKCELFEPITNYDRFKAMNKELIAEMLGKFCLLVNDCELCPYAGQCPETHDVNAWLDWLHSEAKDGTENT